MVIKMETLYHQDSIEIRPRGVKNGAGLLLELVNEVLDMEKLESGMNAHISKPINVKLLLDTISKMKRL